MTVLVGILATNGVVIAADSSATFGTPENHFTISEKVEKIKFNNQLIMAGTGEVGMSQRFWNLAEPFMSNLSNRTDPLQTLINKGGTAQMNAHPPALTQAVLLKSRNLESNYISIGESLSSLMVKNLGDSGAHLGKFGALVAYHTKDSHHLCEFSTKDFQPEQKSDKCWYVSMGSGQILADAYLAFIRRTFWASGQPSVQDAIFAAVWTMHHAIDAAPGFIGKPIHIAVLKKWDGSKYSSKCLTPDEVGSHLEAVQAANDHLVKFRDPPPIPAPAAPTPPPQILPTMAST